MTTIKDIAEKAGVSIGTVDRVFHNRGRVSKETEKRVKEIADALGYVPNQLGRGLAARKKKLNIAFMIPDSEQAPSQFYSDLKKGALSEIEALKQYDITVRFYPITFDFETGEDVYPDPAAIAWEELDGLVTLGGNSETLKEILARAEEHNIPAVLYNMDTEVGTYLAVVQCNYIKSGRIAAGLSALMTDQKGCIGIISLDSDKVPSYTKRCEGFRQELKEHYPSMSIGFTAILKSAEISTYCRTINDLIRLHPEVSVIYVVNPGDYHVCEAIYNASDGTNIRIITNDLDEYQRQMLLDGKIAATICQDPEMQGSLPLKLLTDYLIFEKLPEASITYTNLSVNFRQTL